MPPKPGLPPRQRNLGILLGAGAAVVLRIIFTVLVAYLLDVPWLKLAGGILLLWIAVKLLMGGDEGEGVASGSSLLEAVKIVAIADIVMSLDNVLAIAAAAQGAPEHLRFWLILLGLAISIPLVVAGSTLIVGLLTRFPILVWAGAALLGWVAGELIAIEPALHGYVASLAGMLGVSEKFVLRGFEVLGAVLVVLLGWLLRKPGHEPEVVGESGHHEAGRGPQT